MKWIIAVLTLAWMILAGLSLKEGSDVAGWQDRENSALNGVLAVLLFAIDAVFVICWALYKLFFG